ncbi:MAG: type VI secretion system tip protein VgrG [Polyangiaceae bacterium]|nr:type VI secretion system tip protein VgrG [Polyangiaceae bacterium]
MASAVSTLLSAGENLSVTLTSGDAVSVREFHVHEQMSALFSVTLTVVAENHDLDFEANVGQPATFTMRGGHELSPKVRTWTGVLSELHQLAAQEGGLSTYHIEIVPSLWLATQRRNHRMFQQMSEIDIVKKLLGEWGVEPILRLTGEYKKRKYRVQYGETDYTFICRMLEDAGVSHFFEQQGGESKLVLADAPEKGDLREPRIPFRDEPTVADREHVTAVRIGRLVRPGKVTMQDHDYRRPPTYKLMASASAGGPEERLESYHYTPGAFLFESDKLESTPNADDKGRYRADEGEAAKLAQKRLDAKRSEATTCSFETNALDLAPGTVAGMLDHPRSDLGDSKRLLVVEVTHSGTHDSEWTHSVDARSADAPFHPALRTPKPRISGVESATVVGPAGQEIFVDEFGRVRVHFHWDRESNMDDNSSCWIHVSQPWGGTGFGGMNIPRIGQEVLVDFLGGDPDRPIIIGRVYTNLQKVPYKLPDLKTQSGWKSNSTGGTGGYNELMFEDQAGKELVRMQAERDHNKLVKHDEQATIGNDRTKRIGRDEVTDVGRDRTEKVGNDEKIEVVHDRTEKVGNDEHIEIVNDRTAKVGHDETVEVVHDRKSKIGHDEQAEVTNDRTRKVGHDETIEVTNDRRKKIGNDENIEIGHDRVALVKANEDLTVKKNLTKRVILNEDETTGQNRTVTVGINRTTKIGQVDSNAVGEKYVVTISGGGGGTSETMTDGKIVLTTGKGATITMENDTITIEATNIYTIAKSYLGATSGDTAIFGGMSSAHLGSGGGKVSISAATTMSAEAGAAATVAGATTSVLASGGDVLIQGPMVKINP